jgi:hypothetical protein
VSGYRLVLDGTIDHACTAWMAQMAWMHYRYGLDESILHDVAWPLLNGAFEGYWAMHEKRRASFRCLSASARSIAAAK